LELASENGSYLCFEHEKLIAKACLSAALNHSIPKPFEIAFLVLDQRKL
jgi:hypothetical protein